MPLTDFICSDGEKIKCEDCVTKCRLPDRCYPLAMLRRIVKGRRKWTGIPSATQLLKDCRQAYLMEKKDYAQTPDEHTLALLGTIFHETVEMDFERMTYRGLYTGLPDWYDEETGELIDYKVSGEYKYKKGDFKDYTLQLNMYRLLLEQEGHVIKSMKIAFIKRDGSLSRNGTFTWIPIQRMDDEELIKFVTKASQDLCAALELDVLPAKCTDTWRNGLKCKKYCSVKKWCDNEEA